MARPKAFEENYQLKSAEAADLLQCTPGAINKWVSMGLIAAYQTPGGHHRILVKDLKIFVKKTGLPMPTELQD
jgi:excisionase family DNA binding protein